jgi:hypothetical protein
MENSQVKKMYAFGCPRFQSREASGVVEDTGGNWWFFWCQSDDPEPPPGMHFVCIVKHVIDTVGHRYNTQDTDMLSDRQHLSFMYEYVGRVKNPEVLDMFRCAGA